MGHQLMLKIYNQQYNLSKESCFLLSIYIVMKVLTIDNKVILSEKKSSGSDLDFSIFGKKVQTIKIVILNVQSNI
jgi:hypothetical protein